MKHYYLRSLAAGITLAWASQQAHAQSADTIKIEFPTDSFTTLTQLSDSLRKITYDAPVHLNISGEHHGVLTLDSLGTSAEAPLIISGPASLYNNAPTALSYSDDKLARYRGVLNIINTPYVSISGVAFATTSTAHYALVRLMNGAHHVSFTDCSFAAPTTSASDNKLLDSYDVSYDSSSVNSHISIKESTFDGGSFGVSIGNSYVTVPTELGHSITENTFTNQGNKAVYVRNGSQLYIANNNITATPEKTNYNSIDVNCDTAVISANFIKLASDTTLQAVYIRNNAFTTLTNNVVIVDAPSSHAFYYTPRRGKMGTSLLYHNSAKVTGNNSYVVFINRVPTQALEVRNNILIGSPGIYQIGYTPTAATTKLSYNVTPYVSGSVYAKISGEEKTEEEWKEYIIDYHYTYTPELDSLLAPTKEFAAKVPYLTSVPTDFNGAERSITETAPGAYIYEVTTAVVSAAQGTKAADEGTVVYYDLSGRRVQPATQGIYLKKQGNRVEKVMIR